MNPGAFRGGDTAGPESIARDQPRWPWSNGLPTLQGTFVDLRPLRRSDAPALSILMADKDVTQFLAEPPASVAAFERFIERYERDASEGAAFVMAIAPHGLEIPVGIVQVRQLDARFETAEWGFVLASAFWGTGVFSDAARLLLRFAFEDAGIHRLEARCVLRNGRGNGALQKLGAVKEGVLRQSCTLDGARHDQALWALVASDRPVAQISADLRVH